MIQLSNVSKRYFGGNRVLEGVSLKLERGEFLYLVGGSGAGKSSLLRLISGEEQPSEGSVSLFGYDWARASSSTKTAIRRCIGSIPQGLRLLPDLTVFDNLELSLRLAGHKMDQARSQGRVDEIVDKLGLRSKLHTRVEQLSGGEAQRVAVARALVRLPELIVADEPTGAQDRDQTWNVMELLMRANVGGTTVVVATHDREIVRRVRKRCATLAQGRLHLEDSAGFACTR